MESSVCAIFVMVLIHPSRPFSVGLAASPHSRFGQGRLSSVHHPFLVQGAALILDIRSNELNTHDVHHAIWNN